MKKRILSLLLVFCLLFSLVPTAAFAVTDDEKTTVELTNPFKDVKETDWCYDAVQYARINGFFNGTTKTTFDPNGTMTRGMFVTVLGRMAGVDTDAYKGKSSFSDVPATKYYAPYVAWAAKYGITNGTGEGTFSPNALINRQQMAAFFVRYFEAFDVDYETGANITTIPADLANVSSYAKDAVLKLWKQGLLNGDGTNFNPGSNATRAHAATLSMRADQAVETWYKEPGVPSERVSIDPAAPQQPEKPQQPAGSGSSSGSIPGGGGSTQYYEVKFALGSDQTADITLPATSTYPAGTLISALPTPSKTGTIFLGWYYDAAMTDGVETGDTVNRNMTLYAKVAAGEEVVELDTPDYVTRTEVAEGTYSFDVLGAANVASAIKFTNVTGGNMDVAFSVSGTRVTAVLEPGQTYQVELTDDNAYFHLNGESEAQLQSVRCLNILTAKAEVVNAGLNEGVKQIRKEETSGLSGEVFDGLYQIDESGTATQNESSGTFTYSNQPLHVGDTVAITEGNVNLNDVKSTAGEVAYVKITAVNGNEYSYVMADVEDVLFVPDVLPIQSDWDSDSTDNQITISQGNLVTAMSNVEAESLDEGDFLAFLGSGVTYDENTTTAASYGEITGVTTSGDSYIITYTAVDESAVDGSLDVYYTQDQEIELTEEEKEQIENEVKQDVEESGYVEEAALYIASMMLESNNLEDIPDMEQVVFSMRTMQDSYVQYGDNSVTRAGNGTTVKVKFDKTNIRVGVSANNTLEHLQGKGFDVSVKIPFIVTITGTDGNKLQIKVTAEFEEEVILKQKISTKRHKIGFLKYDYSLNATFEVGNYTGIDFEAKIMTADSGNEALAEKLEKILDKIEEYQKGGTDFEDGTMDSLAEVYHDLMENANDHWIDVVNVKLFETNGNAFLHIFCWQIKGSFVVSANLNVAIGMHFDYTMQKQYNFSVRVKEKTATNKVVDIIEPQYNFDFYVIGTIGIRAGLRLEMYVGLISLKLDKIGITAEVGAYTRLWGYFFYHLEWTQSNGKMSNSAGAMLVEIGIYLEIKFVAQVFNSSKLTWNPTLYSKEWPLWSAGERQNVYAFYHTGDTDYTMITTKTLALPGSTYNMKYMDLKNGKTGAVSKDDAGESCFIISFSNPAFAYSPATNTVTVTPANGSLEEETAMTITWKKAPLSFTSSPIQKEIHLSWSDPEGLRYINFDSMGGSAVEQISAGSGAAITWPANPTKQGYVFGGWYTDSACTAAYDGSKTEMPTFAEGTKGMTLYAKWTAGTANYTVEHYLQELNGTYTLDQSEQKTGTTDAQTNVSAYTVYIGFTGKPVAQQTIAGDGSTVVEVYYDRNTYTVTFRDGVSGENDVTRTYLYDEEIAAPVMAREGYSFSGWSSTLPETVTENATYTAQWTGNENMVLFDAQGGSTVDSASVRTGEKVTQPADPTRNGYIFGGWYSDRSGIKAWNFASDVVSGDVTLYAKWTATNYPVTFNANGGSAVEAITADHGTTITKPADPTKDGYTFGGWYKDADCTNAWNFDSDTVVSETTLYAKWTIKQYEVTFAVNGGSAVESVTVDHDRKVTEPTAPTKTGYTFGGWYKDAECTTAWDFESDTVTEAVTLYAKWTANDHTITWNANGGLLAGEESITQNVKYDDVITAPIDAPEKEAAVDKVYTFDGWYTAAEGGEKVTDFGTVSGNVTYYAHWSEAVRQYTVSFNTNGGGEVASMNVGYGGKVTKPADPTKDGYTFGDWYKDAECTTAWDFESDTVTEAVTLYAKWTANDHTITWNANGGKLNGQTGITQNVKYDDVITKPADPTRASTVETVYTFDGWYTAAEGGEKVTSFGTVSGNVTYYAHWSEAVRQYTVSFNTNGGGEVASMNVGYGGKVTKPADPTKDGYTFGGWYKDAECTTAWDFESDTVTEAVTLYAKWVEGPVVEYNLWIGDQQFTSAHLVIKGSEFVNGSGTATFDPVTYTLTLNNFQLTASAPEKGVGSGLIMYEIRSDDQKDLTIKLIGNNRIENTYTANWGRASCGVFIWGSANLNIIDGDNSGSLTCVGGMVADDDIGTISCGIYLWDSSSILTIDIGGTLTAEGQTKGIWCYNVETVSGTVQKNPQ